MYKIDIWRLGYVWHKVIRMISDIFLWLVSKIPIGIGDRIRRFVYSRLFRHCGYNLSVGCDILISGFDSIEIGRNVRLNNNCMIFAGTNGGTLSIGDNCYIGYFSIINASRGSIKIGSNVMIANNVTIEPSNHIFSSLTKPMSEQGHSVGSVHIEDDVWIGANCTILKDVSIGKGAIVAAGCVVTKDVEPYTVVGGVPAREIKKRC